MKNPSKRIGYSDTALIKEHKWFQEVDWKAVEALTIEPPLKPAIEDKFDTTNFHKDAQNEGSLTRN